VQTIGRSKGGFASKTQAAALGNPSRLILIGGQHHEVTPAEALLEGWETEQVERVIADKGYDSGAVVGRVEAMPGEAVIPPKANCLEQRE